MPQVWLPPALIAVKVPAGGVDWPNEFSPQQMTVPLARTPQLWLPPALTAVNAPAGVPETWPKKSAPQQMMVPFVRNAQL
jgi:hypothetical protein